MSYPIRGRNDKNGYLTVHVNILKAVDETFGHDNWKYDKLIGFRLRGSGKLQSILLR